MSLWIYFTFCVFHLETFEMANNTIAIELNEKVAEHTCMWLREIKCRKEASFQKYILLRVVFPRLLPVSNFLDSKIGGQSLLCLKLLLIHKCFHWETLQAEWAALLAIQCRREIRHSLCSCPLLELPVVVACCPSLMDCTPPRSLPKSIAPCPLPVYYTTVTCVTCGQIQKF